MPNRVCSRLKTPQAVLVNSQSKLTTVTQENKTTSSIGLRVGYASLSMRLFNPTTDKVIISQFVKLVSSPSHSRLVLEFDPTTFLTSVLCHGTITRSQRIKIAHVTVSDPLLELRIIHLDQAFHVQSQDRDHMLRCSGPESLFV